MTSRLSLLKSDKKCSLLAMFAVAWNVPDEISDKSNN